MDFYFPNVRIVDGKGDEIPTKFRSLEGVKNWGAEHLDRIDGSYLDYGNRIVKLNCDPPWTVRVFNVDGHGLATSDVPNMVFDDIMGAMNYWLAYATSGGQSKTFPLGIVVCTPGIMQLWEQGLNPIQLLTRHANQDWGDLDQEDVAENQFSIWRHLRLLSSYVTEHGKVWIITEADRSSTCILLPDEY